MALLLFLLWMRTLLLADFCARKNPLPSRGQVLKAAAADTELPRKAA